MNSSEREDLELIRMMRMLSSNDSTTGKQGGGVLYRSKHENSNRKYQDKKQNAKVKR